ncbi:LexA family protein [Acetobacterium wieringae]|uniref:LexA repressor n=1 Tax=Acetobacterium wieringae TaxID=52694 RepID=A0A1F2PCJ1_9FIRM|nr:LexA family transcriptional regulator [Acetobacterium wieringae]OFV69140.1 LexA repressor [Acetobacterium wieringae]
MSNFASRLKELRKESGLTQIELSTKVGISKSSISMYEANSRKPELETLEALADYFNVNMDYLLGKSNIRSHAENLIKNIFPIEKKKFPLLGNVACGQPILATENFEGYIESGSNIHADFCLKAKGDSMVNARILDGDIVFIRKQEMVENGEIAAILIDEEATLKRFYMNNDFVQLIAENPSVPPMIYKKEELNGIRILGKAIAFQSDVI